MTQQKKTKKKRGASVSIRKEEEEEEVVLRSCGCLCAVNHDALTSVRSRRLDEAPTLTLPPGNLLCHVCVGRGGRLPPGRAGLHAGLERTCPLSDLRYRDSAPDTAAGS